MNAVGCWFTFGPDALCLYESVTEWRDLTGGCPVAVFIDQDHPIPEKLLRKIAPEMVEHTAWERGGNLNGWDAVLGILDSLERACQRFNLDHVFKIDCDTLCNPAGWWDPQAMMSGCELGTQPLPCGHAYALKRAAISLLIESFTRPGRMLFPCLGTVMEDWIIGAEAMRLFPGQVTLSLRDQARDMVCWQYGQQELPAEYFKGRSVVTFGNRHQLTGCGSERRERAAIAMAKHRKLRRKWRNQS